MWFGVGGASSASFFRALTTRQSIASSEHARAPSVDEGLPDFNTTEPRWTALAAKYAIGSELGVGGAGQVYGGLCRRTKLPVAIKAVRAHLAADLRREAALLRTVEHRSVVKVVDVLQEGFMVTELLGGGELFDRLTRCELQGETDAQRGVLRDIFAAVAHLHAMDIAHLDLKPENIVLEDDLTWNLRLVDFGSARRTTDSDESDRPPLHSSPRTAAYSPPEILRRERGVDPKKVDAWAVGCVAYFVLTGAHPFDRGGEATDADVEKRVLRGAERTGAYDGPAWDAVPEALRALIARCLAEDPDDRPALRELADAEWLRPREHAAADAALSIPRAPAASSETRPGTHR